MIVSGSVRFSVGSMPVVASISLLCVPQAVNASSSVSTASSRQSRFLRVIFGHSFLKNVQIPFRFQLQNNACACICQSVYQKNTEVRKRFLCLMRCSLFRHDLDPIPVRILYKVDAHAGIFKADAAHGRVLCVRGIHIRHGEREVKLPLAEVIRLRAVTQPGQLELKRRVPVTQKHEPERAVGCILRAHGLQAERIMIKLHAARKIEDVEIEVIEGKHTAPPK